MATLIVLFNLKPGQNIADYEKWAKETDVPTVKGLKSVDDFRVYRAKGLLGSDARAPYQYIEVLEINNMDGLLNEIGSEIMQKIAAAFQGMADNPTFIVTEQFA
jgi:hypothetical protein